MTKPSFNVSVSVNEETGDVMAVYFRIREGNSHETREVVEGKAFADYDEQGQLLGIELLGPCDEEVFDKIAPEEPVRRFLRRTAPRALVEA